MKKTTFAEWMAKVDEWCYRLAGCSASDLCDLCYADMHDNGVSPKAAARRAIRNEMGCDE